MIFAFLFDLIWHRFPEGPVFLPPGDPHTLHHG